MITALRASAVAYRACELGHSPEPGEAKVAREVGGAPGGGVQGLDLRAAVSLRRRDREDMGRQLHGRPRSPHRLAIQGDGFTVVILSRSLTLTQDARHEDGCRVVATLVLPGDAPVVPLGDAPVVL